MRVCNLKVHIYLSYGFFTVMIVIVVFSESGLSDCGYCRKLTNQSLHHNYIKSHVKVLTMCTRLLAM